MSSLRRHHIGYSMSGEKVLKKDVNAKQSSNFQKHIDTITDALTELTLDGVLRTCPGENVP